MAKPDIAVIGAGFAGLALAWRLARGGLRVHVFDQSAPGALTGAASAASGGMLNGRLEVADLPPPVRPLALKADTLWPGFAAEIEAAGGGDCRHTVCGALLSGGHVRTHAHTPGLETLTPGAVRLREPLWGGTETTLLFDPLGACVDPRAVLGALRRAARAAGVVIQDEMPVQSLTRDKNRISGVTLPRGEVSAGHVVVATGAYMSELIAPLQCAWPGIRPMKGQMLALHLPAENIRVRCNVWGDGVYVIPQHDGRIVIGATLEDAGFDPHLNNAALHELHRRAALMLPALRDAQVIERWFGYRPASGDGLPFAGGIGLDGLTLIGGQYRNGVLLTPVMVQAAAMHIAQSRLDADHAVLAPQRHEAVLP